MPRTYLQNDQIINKAQLHSLGSAADTENKDILTKIEATLDQPMRLYAAFPTPDSKLYFATNRKVRGDGVGVATPPIKSQVPDLSTQWIDFQSGSVSGNFDITLPSTTVGQYRRCGFTLLSTGQTKAKFSAAATTVSGLENGGTLFIGGGIPLGWIDLQATASTAFKTIGSSTSVIENSVGGTSRIVIFGSGGGGGSGVEVFDTVSLANARIGSQVNDLIWVVQTQTLYIYQNPASTLVDSLYILADSSNASARWQGVAGKYIYQNFNQNSYVAKTLNVLSAVSGVFDTGHSGIPMITVSYWDNTLSKYLVLDEASYITNINQIGTQITYDFQTLTFGGSDFVKIQAVYHDLVSSLANEYDSGWILRSAINNTAITGSVSGSHRVDLPSGFSDVPGGCTIMLNDGTNPIKHLSLEDRVTFGNNGAGVQRIAVNVLDLGLTEQFRILASQKAQAVGVAGQMDVIPVAGSGTLLAPTAETLYKATITGIATTNLPAAASTIGIKMFFKNPTAFAWTVSGVGGDLLDGQSTFVIGGNNYAGYVLISDGTGYNIFG